jgi:hypothetical protein
VVSLYQWYDYLERTITGPGVARVWTAPRFSYRYSTQSTRMSLVGGASVTITAPSSFGDPPYSQAMWQLAELAVPAGTHMLRLENVETGTREILGLFDDFSFDANGTQLTLADAPWMAQIGQPFEAGPGATTTATFSATGLPPGLSIDATTGRITGKPLVAGEFTLTITAEGPVSSDTKEAKLTVTNLGVGADQPSWNWRTAASAAHAWRLVDENVDPPLSVDGVDVLEVMTPVPSDSWVEAEVSGPGWVKWKQRTGGFSMAGSATIAVVVDGVPVGPPVPPPWEGFGDRRVWIPDGMHTVRWTAQYVPSNILISPPTAPLRIDTVSFESTAGLPGAIGSVTYDAWAAALPEGLRGPDQDANGNGATNWAEYAFSPPPNHVWPVAATVRADGDWVEFQVAISAAASEGVWSLRVWHDGIPSYPGGWSAATCRDYQYSLQGNVLTARIKHAAKTGVLPPSVNPYLIEPASSITGSFAVSRAR